MTEATKRYVIGHERVHVLEAPWWAPRRIQRRRTKGWRIPAGAVYVGRGSRWGNPIRVGEEARFVSAPEIVLIVTPQIAAAGFRSWIEIAFSVPQWVAPLQGKDLVCWCPLDQPCHADVLLELANPADIPRPPRCSS